jgi:hypothetical protein
MDARVCLTYVCSQQKKFTFHAVAHNLWLSRLRPPLSYHGFIFFFTSGNRRTTIGRTVIHPASYRAPALPKLYLRRFGIALVTPQTPASGCTFSDTDTLSPLTLKFFASTASVVASRDVGGSRTHPGRDEGKKEVCLSFFVWRLQYSCIFSYCYLLLWFGLYGGFFRIINSFCAMLCEYSSSYTSR